MSRVLSRNLNQYGQSYIYLLCNLFGYMYPFEVEMVVNSLTRAQRRYLQIHQFVVGLLFIFCTARWSAVIVAAIVVIVNP